MIKKYKLKIKSYPYKSDLLEEKSPPLSDLYLLKNQGWLEYSITVSDSLKDYIGFNLIDQKFYKEHTTIKVNSLNFKLTNIVINEVPYVYKIVSSKAYSLKDIRKLLNDYSIIEVNSSFYTNKEGYYKTESELIFTDNVINLDDCEIVYKSKHIEVKTPKNCTVVPNTTILTPHLIDEYNAFIPSFFITLPDKELKCVDSNPINKEEKTNNLKEYLRYRVIKPSNKCSQSLNMSFDVSDIVLQSSTHILSIPSESKTYYIEDNGNITDEVETAYYFTIHKNVNLDKIDLITNTYKYVDSSVNQYKYINSKVLSYTELNESINSAFDQYIGISNLFPVYNLVSIDIKNPDPDRRSAIQILHTQENENNSDTSFINKIAPFIKSINRVPCLFEEELFKTKIVDGVKYNVY